MTRGIECPTPAELDRALRVLEPFRILSAPKCFGMENIPEKGPMLLVGNHTIYGVLDVPMMWRELYLQKGIFLRALGHHFHFRVPIWRDFILRYGVVEGTRENCSALMDAGQPILVFPGGGREVAKRKGEKYKLIWKERIGFARMAIKHGCPIVPFSAVGAEENFDIVWDADNLAASPIGPLLQRLGLSDEMFLPIAKGIGPTPIPRPQRLYFRFGQPISTAELAGDFENTATCLALREKVRAEVEFGIAWLRQQRKTDPKRNFLPRVVSELRKLAAAREARQEQREAGSARVKAPRRQDAGL